MAGGERMDLDETTIANLFKKAGYVTGALESGTTVCNILTILLAAVSSISMVFARAIGALLQCLDGKEWGTRKGERVLRGRFHHRSDELYRSGGQGW